MTSRYLSIIGLTLGIALIQCSADAQVAVSAPAGFVQIHLPSNSTSLAAAPFETFGTNLVEQLDDQLVGDISAESADNLLFWRPDIQQYMTIFKAADGSWYLEGTNGAAYTYPINPGEGFWIVNRHIDQNLFLAGTVILNSTMDILIKQGLNAIAYPYLSSIHPSNAAFYACGATAGTSAETGDLLIVDGVTNWLSESVGGVWQTMAGGATTDSWNIAAAAWYLNRSTNDLHWMAPRPYSNLFSTASNTPQIVWIGINPTNQSAILTIKMAGATGEVVELFYQDVTSTGKMENAAWQMAGEGLTGDGAWIVWEDAGDTGRLSPTNVFCRLYVAARQDIDSDGDGISDAREMLVMDYADTDNDGLSDAWEMNYFGNLNQTAETDYDNDGITDGSEYARGTNPTDLASGAVTLFANAVVGNNAYDGLSASVTATHGPKAGIQAAVTVAFANDRIEIASGSYAESGLSNSIERVILAPMGTVQITP